MSTQKSLTFLITGVSSGFGRALAEAAFAAGHRVAGTVRNESACAEFEALATGKAKGVVLDVTDTAAIVPAVAAIEADFGPIDVLVNNAGYGNVAPLEDTSLAEFRAQIEANLFGTIIVTKAALPLMRRQRAGHIIQFSSVGGRIGAMGRAPYSAAKWGVEGFSEVLAKETGPLGIKVTIIEPGGFRTDFAGASTQLHEGHPDYDITVGAAARFQRDFDGAQPGDPARAAKAILEIADLDKPPLRLLLGSDAYGAVSEADLKRIEADRTWRHLSLSTDFDAAPAL